jgi:hypothetical protein
MMTQSNARHFLYCSVFFARIIKQEIEHFVVALPAPADLYNPPRQEPVIFPNYPASLLGYIRQPEATTPSSFSHPLGG